MAGQLKITMKKSLIGRLPLHRKIIAGLGLRRINHSVIREDTAAIRGMVKKIPYLVEVEEL